MGLRERWRSGPPELVVLAGSVVGIAGNAVWIAYVIEYLSDEGALAVAVVGILFCMLGPLALRWRWPRTEIRFGMAGLAASLIVLLTPPGIVGGGIALVGSLWGLLATEARRSA